MRLYPLYHPAAALYTPSTLEMLRADFLRIPEILSLGPPPQPELEPQPAQPQPPAHQPQPEQVVRSAPVEPPGTPASVAPAPGASDQQLGLF